MRAEGGEEAAGVGLRPGEEEEHGRGAFAFGGSEGREDAFEVVLRVRLVGWWGWGWRGDFERRREWG